MVDKKRQYILIPKYKFSNFIYYLIVSIMFMIPIYNVWLYFNFSGNRTRNGRDRQRRLGTFKHLFTDDVKMEVFNK